MTSQLRTSKLTLANSLTYTEHTSPWVIQLSPFLTFTVPQTKISLSIQFSPPENCLTDSDFNSHSTSWGYEESDRRGDEVEDWQIENNLLLLNDPEDPPTFFSRPDLHQISPLPLMISSR